MSAFFGSISLEIHQRKSSSRFFTSEHRGMPALRAPEFVANIKPPEPAYVRPAASTKAAFVKQKTAILRGPA
jgi:hypothetical protein